jgi:hypothetical protein
VPSSTNPDALVLYPFPHPNTLSNVTHPGLVINQVQEGARKLYRVKWPYYHYSINHVLPHALRPSKKRQQRKGILQLLTWRSVPPLCDIHLQLFTQKVNDVSRNCAISKFEEWKVWRVILFNIPQFLHPTCDNNISKDASIVHYESKGRYGI